jgi:hypothetical protein
MDTVPRNEPTVWFTIFGDDVLGAEGIAAAGARLRFATAAPDQADALLAGVQGCWRRRWCSVTSMKAALNWA